MRKLMFMILIGGCGLWYFKSNMNIGGDDHSHTVGFALPTMGVGAASGIKGTLSSYLPGQSPSPAAAAPMPAGPNTSGLSPDILKLQTLPNSAAATQNLTPAALQTLQKLIAQARANPAAFQEQYGATGKPSQGAR